MTAHWLDDDFRMKKATLSVKEFKHNHTSTSIAAVMRRIFADYAIIKPFALVADNASDVQGTPITFRTTTNLSTSSVFSLFYSFLFPLIPTHTHTHIYIYTCTCIYIVFSSLSQWYLQVLQSLSPLMSMSSPL